MKILFRYGMILCFLVASHNAQSQFQVVYVTISPVDGNVEMSPSRLPDGTGADQLKALEAWAQTTGGSPSETLAITITPDAVEGTGGHVQANHNARSGEPQGVAIDLNGEVDPANGNMQWDHTGPGVEYWVFNTNFRAPEPSGDHNVTATAGGQSGSAIIRVTVDDLVALQAGADYELIGGTPPHPNANSHYGVQSLINDIPNIADDWNEWLQGRSGDEGENNTLKVNDMSLVWGGLFDVGQNVNGQLTGNWRRPHQTHREGRDMDVRVWRWNNATGWGVPVGLAPAQDGTRPDYRTNFQDIVDDYNQNAGVVVETDPHHIHVNWD